METRFQDLRSSDEDQTTKPKGFMTINNVKVTVTVQDNLKHAFIGHADFGGKDGPATSVVGGINKGLSWILDYAKLNTKARSRADVTISVQNDLIPAKLSMLNTRIGDDELESPFEFKSAGEIVYDTWKAWPHRKPGGGSNNDNGTDVYESYKAASHYTAEQVKNIAFFGLNKVGIFSTAASVVNSLGLPVPWLVSSYLDDQKGPIAMLP